MFLHLDLWREDTDKGDYIMIPSEMSLIEEEASSSRAVVHTEYCKKKSLQIQITMTLSHVNQFEIPAIVSSIQHAVQWQTVGLETLNTGRAAQSGTGGMVAAGK